MWINLRIKLLYQYIRQVETHKNKPFLNPILKYCVLYLWLVLGDYYITSENIKEIFLQLKLSETDL